MASARRPRVAAELEIQVVELCIAHSPSVNGVEWEE
jgi:hypothetical protein